MSPFALPAILRVFSLIGGLPVRLDPWDPRRQKESIRFDFVRPAILVLLLLAPTAFLVADMAWFGRYMPQGLDGPSRLADTAGISVVDILLTFGMLNFVAVCVVITCAVFYFKRRAMRDLYVEMAKFRESFSVDQGAGPGQELPTVPRLKSMRECKSYRNFAFFSVFMAVAGTTVLSVGITRINQRSRNYADLEVVDWLAMALVAVATLASVCNPVLGGAISYSMDAVNGCSDSFLFWKTQMDGVKFKVGEDVTATLNVQAAIGTRVLRLVSEANSTLAPFLVTIYAYFLGGGVIYAYGAFTVAFNHGLIPFLLAMGHACLALAFFTCIFQMSRAGDSLQCHKESARVSLHALMHRSLGASGESGPDEQARFEINSLLEELRPRGSGGSATISPYGYFEVSNSNYLGVMATLVTYIIVLLQFRPLM